MSDAADVPPFLQRSTSGRRFAPIRAGDRPHAAVVLWQLAGVLGFWDHRDVTTQENAPIGYEAVLRVVELLTDVRLKLLPATLTR